jgi:hypothetical protein
VKDVRRSVAGPLSAASARCLPIGDSDFQHSTPQPLTFKHRILPFMIQASRGGKTATSRKVLFL